MVVALEAAKVAKARQLSSLRAPLAAPAKQTQPHHSVLETL